MGGRKKGEKGDRRGRREEEKGGDRKKRDVMAMVCAGPTAARGAMPAAKRGQRVSSVRGNVKVMAIKMGKHQNLGKSRSTTLNRVNTASSTNGSKRTATSQTHALPLSSVAITTAHEVAQLAVYEDEIFQTAGIVFGCVLLGLSLGFVLLKVESLVEESA